MRRALFDGVEENCRVHCGIDEGNEGSEHRRIGVVKDILVGI
jgi:hypothetical protein